MNKTKLFIVSIMIIIIIMAFGGCTDTKNSNNLTSSSEYSSSQSNPSADAEMSWKDAYYNFILNNEYANNAGVDTTYYTESDDSPVQFLLFDIGDDGIPELITNNGGETHYEIQQYVYTFDEETNSIQFLGKVGLSYGSTFKYIPNTELYPGLICESFVTGGRGNYEYIYMDNGSLKDDTILTYNDHMGELMIDSETQDSYLYNLASKDIESWWNDDDYVSEELWNADLLSKQDILELGWENFVIRYLRGDE